MTVACPRALQMQLGFELAIFRLAVAWFYTSRRITRWPADFSQKAVEIWTTAKADWKQDKRGEIEQHIDQKIQMRLEETIGGFRSRKKYILMTLLEADGISLLLSKPWLPWIFLRWFFRMLYTKFLEWRSRRR